MPRYRGTSVEIPNLFYEISESLIKVLSDRGEPWTRAEFAFLRRRSLEYLEGMGFTQETYGGQQVRVYDAAMQATTNFYENNI